MPRSALQTALLHWYDCHKRDLPWRKTSDPYAIWVSEIMLQQTQVSTVIPYWERWMARFPTVESLAVATEEDILSLWQGLGYYRRGRMLWQGAVQVCSNGMPTSASEWERVSGVGRYTGGAIASIALGEVVPLVDGNVQRVYARLNADTSEEKLLSKSAWDWAGSVVDSERPGDWNQALMELGATVCKPKDPSCSVCPLTGNCMAFRQGLQGSIPRAKVRQVTKSLSLETWIPLCEGRFGVRQIPASQWWEGMWEFPRASATSDVENAELRGIVGEGWVQHVGSFRHAVTHHRILLSVSRVYCESQVTGLQWVTGEELEKLSLPAPMRKALGMSR